MGQLLTWSEAVHQLRYGQCSAGNPCRVSAFKIVSGAPQFLGQQLLMNRNLLDKYAASAYPVRSLLGKTSRR